MCSVEVTRGVWDSQTPFESDTLDDIKYQKKKIMKENINLGSKEKFVGWKANGVTNCLDLCKSILKKYDLSEFGSSSNVFKLMYEKDGKLVHYGTDVVNNYKRAIDCIDRHLESNHPIIVGVNHTIDRGINEGTTDHFVVIYGREYVGEELYYMYYEVGKSDISAGYNNVENRFKYVETNPPYFYDEQSSRGDRCRFDVTQVRPNDGILDGTIPQNGE